MIIYADPLTDDEIAMYDELMNSEKRNEFIDTYRIEYTRLLDCSKKDDSRYVKSVTYWSIRNAFRKFINI